MATPTSGIVISLLFAFVSVGWILRRRFCQEKSIGRRALGSQQDGYASFLHKTKSKIIKKIQNLYLFFLFIFLYCRFQNFDDEIFGSSNHSQYSSSRFNGSRKSSSNRFSNFSFRGVSTLSSFQVNSTSVPLVFLCSVTLV